MAPAVKIFVSATTADLRSFRNEVKGWLLDMGWLPVVQDHFAPDDDTVVNMLTKRISECDAVVHIIGKCYGAEPKSAPKGEPRRSYTQLEAAIARKLKKRLFTVLLDEAFPYDEHEPEAPEHRILQEAYRLQVATGEHLYIPCLRPADLEPEIRKLRVEIDKLNKSRRRLALLTAVPLLILLPGGAFFLYEEHRLEDQQRQFQAKQSALESTVIKLTQVEDRVDAAPTAAAEDKALAEERNILRPVIPDIDSIPRTSLRGFVTELVDELKRPAANPKDYSGLVRPMLIEAQEKIDALEIPEAAKLLDDALAKISGTGESDIKGRAALLAERGRAARLQLHYREAAKFYQDAAKTMNSEPRLAREYLLSAAGSLYSGGKNFGDNAALTESIRFYQSALALAPRGTEPDAWGSIQDDLGSTYLELGEREDGTAHLEAAIAAFSNALEVRPRDRVPSDWATTQNNLGNAFERWGERESDTRHFEAAIEAYSDALSVRTRESSPLEWATTENNLGNAQLRLGERADDTHQLDGAVVAYNEALKVRTQERVPLQWAATQNNLGYVLRRLGERETGIGHLQDSVAAFEKALTVRTRDRVPLEWAMTKNNLGISLQTWGDRETGTARLEESVVAFTDALKVYTRERSPLDWADTQNNLGISLQGLGERETGTARLEAAVEAFTDVLKEDTRERVPLYWAETQNNLGLALRTLGERETGTARLQAAVDAFEESLKENTRDRTPLDWADTQNNLGNALRVLGERETGTTSLEAAVAAYDEALQVRTHKTLPLGWAISTGNQGVALMLLAKRNSDRAIAKEAVEQIEVAYTTTQAGGNTANATYYKTQLPEARALFEQLSKR